MRRIIMKKLMLIALLFGASVKAENTIFTAQNDPYTEQVVEEYVKPAAKAGFWAVVGYISISIGF